MPAESDRQRRFAEELKKRIEKEGEKGREPPAAERILRKQEELLKKDPRNDNVWFARGLLLTDLGRFEEAKACFDQVAEINPSHEGVWSARANALARLGRSEEAQADYRRALESGAAAVAPELAPPPPESAEETLSRLMEEFAPGPPAKAAVEELEALQAEVDAEVQALLDKIQRWRAEGYDVAPLEDLLRREPDKGAAAVFQFELNLGKARVLRQSLDALDATGFERDAEDVRRMLRSPYNLWQAEAKLAELALRVEQRRRVAVERRAAPAPPRVVPRPVARPAVPAGVPPTVPPPPAPPPPTPAPPPMPGPEIPPEFRAQLEAWRAEGFNVDPLAEAIRKEPGKARTTVQRFAQNVLRAQVLLDELNRLDTTGLEAEAADLRALLRSPLSIIPLEAKMGDLLQKMQARAPPPPPPRPAPAPRPRPPGLPPGAPPGLVNGRVRERAPGRINGLPGRVNGRINGLGGRVNGLVNGVAAARRGLTNGLTNGLGFTNGLGHLRALRESRGQRWKVAFVPLLAMALLAAGLLGIVEPPPGPPVSIVIDGAFGDWGGVGLVTEPTRSPAPNVNLTEYGAKLEGDHLFLLAGVAGQALGDATDYDTVYAFLDADGDADTGYLPGELGADYAAAATGSAGVVEFTRLLEFRGTDGQNWTNFTWITTFRAAAGGNRVEMDLPLTKVASFDAERFVVRFAADDHDGHETRTAGGVSATAGLLFASQTVLDRRPSLPVGSSTWVRLTFRAVGREVLVEAPDYGEARNVTLTVSPVFPLLVSAGQIRTVDVEALVVPPARLMEVPPPRVTADVRTVVTGETARAYAGTVPAAKVIDGVFTDWANDTAVDSDVQPTANANIDLEAYGAAGNGTMAYFYLKVKGEMLGGYVAVEKQKKTPPSPPGQGAPGAPLPPPRRVGEDETRIYVDVDPGSNTGPWIDGIQADALVVVRGLRGRVTSSELFQWAGQWQRTPSAIPARVVAGEMELSASLPFPIGPGSDVYYETTDWTGVADVSVPVRTRGFAEGTNGADLTYYPGIGPYEASLFLAGDQVVFSVGDITLAWGLPRLNVDGQNLSRFPPTMVQGDNVLRLNALFGPGSWVEYRFEALAVKEALYLPASSDSAASVVETTYGVNLSAPARWELPGAGTLAVIVGERTAFRVDPSSLTDAAGRTIDGIPAFSGDGSELTYRFAEPAGLVAPYLVDPTLTFYTLENDLFTAYNDDANERLGWNVSVGDFNGDGYGDVLAGAPYFDGDGTDRGGAYIFIGPFTSDDSTPNVRINITSGIADSSFRGQYVAACDFNNDGRDDAVLGSPSVISVVIVYGSTSWTSSSYTNVTSADVTVPSVANTGRFGAPLACGDINGATDSNDDLLVGTYFWNTNDNSRVLIYLYDGTDWGDGTVNDAADAYLISSASTIDERYHFGWAISVGNMYYPNNVEDIVVGEPDYNRAGGYSMDGRVNMFNSSALSFGGATNTPNHTIDSAASQTDEEFGIAVAAGDLNAPSTTNDYADIVVGARLNDETGTDSGQAYYFLAQDNAGGGFTNNQAGTTLTNPGGTPASDQFGYAVLIFDFEQDGDGDNFVAAPFAEGGGGGRGDTYRFDGTSTSSSDDIPGTQVNENLGQGGIAGGKFSADPSVTLVIGAPGWDDSSPSNSNAGRVAYVPEFDEVGGTALATVALAVFALWCRSERRQDRAAGLSSSGRKDRRASKRSVA